MKQSKPTGCNLINKIALFKRSWCLSKWGQSNWSMVVYFKLVKNPVL